MDVEGAMDVQVVVHVEKEDRLGCVEVGGA